MSDVQVVTVYWLQAITCYICYILFICLLRKRIVKAAFLTVHSFSLSCVFVIDKGWCLCVGAPSISLKNMRYFDIFWYIVLGLMLVWVDGAPFSFIRCCFPHPCQSSGVSQRGRRGTRIRIRGGQARGGQVGGKYIWNAKQLHSTIWANPLECQTITFDNLEKHSWYLFKKSKEVHQPMATISPFCGARNFPEYHVSSFSLSLCSLRFGSTTFILFWHFPSRLRSVQVLLAEKGENIENVNICETTWEVKEGGTIES